MEEEWELLELTGVMNAYAVHGPSDTLIYSIGTVVVLWDINNDRKVNLRCHDNPVTSIAFSSDFEYFITIESSLQPLICVWRWRTLEQVCAKWVPFKPRKSPTANVICSFLGRRLIIAENENEGGYRISLWEWRAPDLILRQTDDLEMQESCLFITLLSDQLSFATAENLCLKIWKIENSVSISKRLHFKNNILQVGFSQSLNLFVVLLENGNVMTVNVSGKSMANYQHPKLRFISVVTYQDYAYFGSTTGSITMYSLRTNRLFRELPSTHQSSISAVLVNGGNILYTLFQDATIQILNMSQGQVINQSSGHCSPVNTVQWTERWNFVSSSNEGCLYVWKYVGKGWNMQAMEVSGGKGYVTAIGVHPSKKTVCCGFSRGTVKFFDLGEKPRYLNSLQISSSEVTDLSFTPSGHFLGVGFSSGQAVILDSNFETVGIVLEEPWIRNQNALQTIKFHECIDGDGMCIKAATLKDSSSIQIQTFEAIQGELERTHFNLFPIDGKSNGFCIHTSGSFLLVTCSLGGIYIFNIDNGEIAGIIETEINPKGCIQDPSGLYIGVFLPNQIGSYVKLVVYETGTGKKSTELSRLNNCSSMKAISWSRDGRFIVIAGTSGFLSVWKVPKNMTDTIFEMMEKLQANPDIWAQFPINLPIKERSPHKAKSKPKFEEIMPQELEIDETRRDKGAFAESVISFVKKPQKKSKPDNIEFGNRITLKPSESNLEQFNASAKSKQFGASREDSPVSLSRETRKNKRTFRSPLPSRSQPNNFYYQSKSPYQRPQAFTENPAIVKSTNKFQEPESIDIDCDVPSYNPAQRLYESHTEKTESLISDAERGYQEIDKFF
ncbi:unnamed protein product [Blepharisma stoltei]|uniref:Uncharacterized protein n=1 Tax=Blepharisma stoltei TaxID=1481888 RepID=A0AAU9IXH9_9CILI|nr:unnamed protein product [Blepharisma stoltei]